MGQTKEKNVSMGTGSPRRYGSLLNSHGVAELSLVGYVAIATRMGFKKIKNIKMSKMPKHGCRSVICPVTSGP